MSSDGQAESSEDDLPFDFGLGEDSPPNRQARSGEVIEACEDENDAADEQQLYAVQSAAIVAASIEEISDEARQKREQEEMLWSSMAPEDATKMKGMLQAVALYQQHLRQNEDTISDLHRHIESKEKTYRSQRRRIQQVGQSAAAAQEQGSRFEQELERWTSKSERYEGIHVDMASLQEEHVALQEKRNQLDKEAESARADLEGLQNRLGAIEAMGQEQASRFQVQDASCKKAVATLRAEHAREQAALNLKHNEELLRWEAELHGRVSELGAQRAADTSRLRTVLADLTRNTTRMAREREDAVEHLTAQQQEGSRLHQQYAEAREEVLDLASQVRAYQDVPRVASQLGMSLDGSMASIEFLPWPGEDPELDKELELVRRQCKALERECQRTHDSLEKKQTECERWRKRALEEQRRHAAGQGSGPEDTGPVESSEHAEPAMPFVLGPS